MPAGIFPGTLLEIWPSLQWETRLYGIYVAFSPFPADDSDWQGEIGLHTRDIRVLCWVMTSNATLSRRKAAALRMWANRCNKIIFISEDPISLSNFTEEVVVLAAKPGQYGMTYSTMAAFDYIYKHHADDADWFLNADDRTYVIVENLRYMLAPYDSSKPLYFGHEHASSGQRPLGSTPGYILSKQALKTFGEREMAACVTDIQIGKCLDSLGVRLKDSRDVLGRDRFHYRKPVYRAIGRLRDWFFPRRRRREVSKVSEECATGSCVYVGVCVSECACY